MATRRTLDAKSLGSNPSGTTIKRTIVRFLFISFNLILVWYMKRFKKHIFVCENVRPKDNPRGCCSEKGSKELRQLFKKRLKEIGLKADVRANAAGCLDACEYGITVLVYPEQTWYGGVTENDVEEIIQKHIIENKPVERLIIKDKRFHRHG